MAQTATRVPSGLMRGYVYGRDDAGIGVSCPSRVTHTNVLSSIAAPPATYASVPSFATTALAPPAVVTLTCGITGTATPLTSRCARSNGTARKVPAAAYTRCPLDT